MTQAYHTLRWQGDAAGNLCLIDQTLLPERFEEITCENVEQVWEAIKALRVRGAPAIGVSAAYGVVLGSRSHRSANMAELLKQVQQVAGVPRHQSTDGGEFVLGARPYEAGGREARQRAADDGIRSARSPAERSCGD